MHTVDPETLASLPTFYHPVVSPDGDAVAFYYDGSGRNELYLLDRDTGERTRVTDGEVPRNARWHLRWDPGGDRIFFHLDEDGDEQNDILAVDPEGGDVETVVAVDGQGMLDDVSRDGRYLLYGSDETEQMNLHRYDTERGERRQLTAFDQPAGRGIFGPADDRVAFVANESADLENRDVYVMATDGSNRRRLDLGEDGSESGVADWFPDGQRLLVGDDAADRSRVGVYDLATDDVEWLGPNGTEESPAAVSPSGRYALATRHRRAATMPVVYDLERDEGRELDVPEGVASFVGGRTPFVDETTVVLFQTRPDERRELSEYDLAADESEVLVPAEYGDVDPDVFVDAEYVTYESEDGLEIGAVFYDPRKGPARATDATDVPGVVLVHGGPHGRASMAFNRSAQFLGSQGYAVLQPNYRGSSGRGREFKRAVHGDWGGMEQVDVAVGGEWLMAREWIDKERVAVYGGSYGGYSVYCQLTMYRDRCPWATGIAWVGITDLHAMYEESMPHFRHMLRKQMGDPEENRDRWRDRSPVEHVDDLEVPIFVIHGVNDTRCPVGQARVFRDALEERGWVAGEDFEYEELDEEGHGSTDIDRKVRAFELLEDYLDRRL
jgi:dipeptidyl aminopeptidase/acylaminoacyl peptidase